MKTETLYEPVLGELQEVETRLRTIAESDFPPLSQLLGGVLETHGKRLRPAVALLVGKLYCPPSPALIAMAAALELLHTASLVHDDSIDRSRVRRGKPTLATLFGSTTAILAGDYLFTQAAELVASTDDLPAIQLFARAASELLRGEVQESLKARDPEVSREEYFGRIGLKTASLFSAAAASGALLSGAPLPDLEAAARYGYNLGLAFQVVDDLLDFTGAEANLGKPVSNDLRQGTLTLPAILLLERYPEDNPVRALLQGPSRHRSLARTLKLLNGSTVIQDCYQIARSFAYKAQESLEAVPNGPCRQSLHDLAAYVVEREK